MQPARHDILLPISQLQFLENAIFSLNLDDHSRESVKWRKESLRRFIYYDSHISVRSQSLPNLIS